MEREIKFRAWDKKVKQWKGLWIFRGGHDGQKTHYAKPEILDLTDYFCNPKYISDKEVALMQYTGLNDKNGKEVYEGDIFKYRLPGYTEDEIEEYTEQVVFEDGQFTLDAMPLYAARSEGEVIGNIYEHPELLK